ncbi:MAG: hypothetical protein IPJ76_09615 [Flavobacteriales bacterium]|nr:MAG: hypothetical protein IPJ76_09615 [Flavobacteriales bacterium]
MDTPEEYARHFATMPDARLMEVIHDPHDRDPAAVAAAHAELERRGLPTDHLRELQQRIADRKANEEAWQQRMARTTRTLKQGASNVFIDDGSLPQERRWRLWLVLALLLPFLLSLPALAQYAGYIDVDALTDPTTYMLLIELAAPPIAMLLLWKHKRAGWFIATGFATMSLVGALILFQGAFSYRAGHDVWTRSAEGEPADHYFEEGEPNGTIHFVPNPSFEPLDIARDHLAYREHILPLLWNVGLMILFLVRRSRALYSVQMKEASIAVAVGAVMYPLWWMMLM